MREVKLTVATGIKGIGKSYRTFKDCFLYVTGRLTGTPRKVLILDVNGHEWAKVESHPSDEHAKEIGWIKPYYVKTIDVRNIGRFNKSPFIEMRRITPFYTQDVKDKKGMIIARKGEEMSKEDLKNLFVQAIRAFRGGLLVIEDMRTLFGDKVPDDVVGYITRNRHRDQDLIWHTQSVAKIQPTFFENIDYVRMHHQADDTDRYEQKLTPQELYKITQILVDTKFFAGEERAFATIDNSKKKIFGAFSPKQFYLAINEYVRTHPEVLKSHLNLTNNDGERIYNYKTAIEKKCLEYYNKFNGN